VNAQASAVFVVPRRTVLSSESRPVVARMWHDEVLRSVRGSFGCATANSNA
jgi:hypothetical protein